MLGSIKAALAAAATSIKSALPTVVAATTATVLAGGCIYYYTIKDGIYEKRNDNVRYVLEEYLSQISTESIVSDGKGGYAYSTNLDKTVEDIVDKLKEAGSNISEYTGKNNEKEILSKFIKAEIITQFPDLRSEDEIRKDKKVGENELQGGIKIIRKDSSKDTSSSSFEDITYKIDKNDQILTYIPYSKFTSKITNNEEDIKNHFSIKKSGTNSTSIDIVVAGWSEETTTVTKVEYIPNNEGTKDQKKEYNPEKETPITTFNEISINYQNSLSKYSMPAGFLWSLLVMGENTSFVEKLADLAINNTEIIIEVQDNVTTTVNTNVQTYKHKKNVSKTVVAEDGTTKEENVVVTAQKESSITTTVETKQSNTSLNLTYAETWIATYKKDYKNTVTNEKIDETDWLKDAEWNNTEDIDLGTDTQVSENANEDKEYEELKAKIIEEITEEKCKELLISKIESLKNTNTLYYVFSWDAENKNNIYNKSVEYMYNYIKSGFIEEFINNITIKKEIGEYITNFWNNKSKEVENIYEANKIEKSNIIDDLYNMLKDISDNMITLTSAQTTVVNQKVENKSANDIQTVNTNTYTSAGTNVQERIDIDEKNNFVAYFNASGRAKEYILQSPDWVYEMLESHEKTANMVDLFKYLLYQSTQTDYGVTEYDFSIIDTSNLKNVSSYGSISVNGTTIDKDEFIECVQNYSSSTGYQERFAKYAEKIYDICVSKNINPILCVAQAGHESNFGALVPANSKWNYWGLGVYNDSSVGHEFSTIDEAIEFYCDTILGYQKPGSIAYTRAKEFAPYNDKITGNMNTIYDILCAYMYLGDYHSGGMWEGVNVKKYLVEYLHFDCNHSESDPTTMEEKAAYVVAYVDESVTAKAKEIFGNKIFSNVGGSILECAETIHSYMEENKYEYCILNGSGCEHTPNGNSCGLNNTFEDSIEGHHNTCCATFVSWVLIDAGYIETGSHGAFALADILENKGFTRVSINELQPGDVIVYTGGAGHIEIYAGDGQIYNAGDTNSIQRANPYTSNYYLQSGTYGLRAPN